MAFFVQQSETICAILVDGGMRNNFDQWFRRRCLLKISYLKLWQPSCSVERNHLCNCERGHHEEHSCEVDMKFGPVV